MTVRRLRIATRKSRLALWQAEFIAAEIRRRRPDVDIELVGMTTRGDQWLSAPLSEIGGKGLFIKELETAILDGRADVAVHSMKDVPAELPSGFALPLIGYRQEVRDVLVSAGAASVAQLPRGARVGSSSLRRRAQLLARRADLHVEPVRGNVNTRLEKLDAGDYDALLLAGTGLQRLGLGDRIREFLSLDDSLPAAGQGALGVECAADRSDVVELLRLLNDPVVARCVTAERAVSRHLGADCSLPIAAYAVERSGRVELRALIASESGERVLRCAVAGVDPDAVGGEAAADLRRQGADAILAALRSARDDDD
ncbi:MAG TPA: hydroxymethylbilane synthase [Pseudomonadales bacterium]|nr:hydroxymethylbilane synthase [Pseudomonadales bacterium]